MVPIQSQAMTPWRCAATALLLGAGWGCAASDEPSFALTAFSPDVAFNDAPLAVMVMGEPLRPTYRFDTMAGAAATDVGTFSVTLSSASTPDSYHLDAVAWQSPQALTAILPARVPAGTYDVVVTDPRGQRRELSQAFTSLGPDLEPPTITFLTPEPHAIVAAGTMVSISLSADDGHGFLDTLEVKVSTDAEPTLLTHPCAVAHPTGQARCDFAVTMPEPASRLDRLVVIPTAIDAAGNTSPPAPLSFRLVPRPLATGLSPGIGPSGGGTEIIVEGTDFVAPITDPGSESRGTELLVDGVLVVPETVSPTELRARTPAHGAGFAKVVVISGGAQTEPMYFEFVAAPAVKLVSPTRGPVTGGTRIAIAGNHFRDQVTRFYAGSARLLDLCFVSANRVEATMPAVTGTGPVAIVAYDEIGGTGVLPDAFTYDPAEPEPPAPTDQPDNGGLEPMLCPTGVP